MKFPNTLLILIIKSIIKDYSLFLLHSNKSINKLDKYEKEKLSVFIEEFFETLSKSEFENSINKISKYKRKNFFIGIFNKFINKPINIVLSGSVEVVSDLVRKSLNLPEGNLESFYKSYFPELKEKEIDFAIEEKAELFTVKRLKKVLFDLINIVKKTGFDNVVVFFDKLDENTQILGDKDKLVNFIKELLVDTSILLSQQIALAFSIWSRAKSQFNKQGVRFDKIKPIDVSWKKDDLKKILEKRLQYFAKSQYKWIDEILENPEKVELIFELSNNSPRDLLHIFSTIYDEQENDKALSEKISDMNIERGILKFIVEYDYNSLFPQSDNDEIEISQLTKILAKNGMITFSKSNLENSLKNNNGNIDKILKKLEEYELVMTYYNEGTDSNFYIITDPKIKYLIEYKMTDIYLSKY